MRTLIFDIETAPMTVHTWGLFKQNIGLNQIVEPSRVLGIGYKWTDEKKVQWVSEFHDGRDAMLGQAWLLLDEADVVVGWNSTPFDVPWLKREFAVVGHKPTSPFLEIDLIKTVRKQFRFESNKLQNISTMLGLKGKMQHSGHSLWVGCLNGDQKSWDTMARYCKQDVALTHQLYEKLKPWIVSAPVVDFTGNCPRCGSAKVQKRGTSRTALSEFQRYQCQSCGGWSRGAKRVDGADLRGVT
jgi:DNA polymerase elongation subunit (family B)